MQKQKIAYYVNTFLMGGIETTLIDYLSRLDQSKFEIKLIIGICMYELEVLLPQIPPHVKIIYILNGQLGSRYYYLKRCGKLSIFKKINEAIIAPLRKIYFERKLINELKSNAIVIDYGLEFIKYRNILGGNNYLKCSFIGYFHYSIKEYYLNNKRKLINFKFNLRFYNKIIIINRQMHIEALEIFPEFADKFILMYHQVDFNRIRKLSQKKSEVTVNFNYIVSVGRLEENQKDFAGLIKAYAILYKEFQRREKLLIVGSGKDLTSLQNLVAQLNLVDMVVFVGAKLNPFPWIAQSSLFVFSSKFEGFAMVLVEAMVLGKAIISTNCPNGPSDVLMNGKCGKMVKMGDVRGFAIAINDLLSDNNLYQHYVKEANLNLERFDIHKNILRLEQLFVE